MLVIDDENDLRRFSCWVLEAEGYLALQAGDCDNGLKLARQEHPDLILLDIKLPDRYGWSVLEEVNSSPQLNDIPVVIFTASADLALRGQAKKLGAIDFLVKPVSAETIRETVGRAIGKKVPSKKR